LRSAEELTKPWRLILLGPADSPYAGGRFTVEIAIPTGAAGSPAYPFNTSYPPLRFLTKIWHPLPNAEGGVCMGELKWSPATRLESIAQLLLGFLSAPSLDNAPPEGPGQGIGAREMLERSASEFQARAREWTALSLRAGGPKPAGGAPAPPAEPADPFAALTAQLVDMGFGKADARKALAATKGNLEEAAERLLSAA